MRRGPIFRHLPILDTLIAQLWGTNRLKCRHPVHRAKRVNCCSVTRSQCCFTVVVFCQGKPAATTQAGSHKGDNAKVGSENVRFAAECKFLSGHLYISDGLMHGLPTAAKEVSAQLPAERHMSILFLQQEHHVTLPISLLRWAHVFLRNPAMNVKVSSRWLATIYI